MSSVKKNYAYNVVYQILTIILPLITAPYISRTIGANGLGIYSFSYSIAQYFALFILLGVNNYGNRTIAAIRDDKDQRSVKFWEIYFLQITLGVIVISIYLLYCTFFVKDNMVIALIQVIYLLSVAFDINWFFFGIENFKVTVTRNIVIKILTVVATFTLVKNESDLVLYSLILSFSYLINQLILWKYLKDEVNFKWVEVKNVLSHLKQNVLLFIPVVATSIYVLTDKVMIGFFSTMTEVGLYEYAEKIRNIPMGFITALGTVMLPKITNLIANNKNDEAVEYTKTSMIFAMFCAFALAFGLAGIAQEFIPWFYGEEFYDSIKILQLLVLSILFASWANVIRTQILIPNHKDNIYIWSTVCGAVSNIVLNIFLIKKYGAIGAVIATVTSEFVVAFYQTIRLDKNIRIKGMIKYIIFYIIAGVIMFLGVRIIGEKMIVSPLTTIIQVVIGAIIYITICGILLFMSRDKMIIEELKKRGNKNEQKN